MRLSLLNPPSVWLISAQGWAQLPWIQDAFRPPQKPLRVLGTLWALSHAMPLIIFLHFSSYLSDSLSEKSNSFSSALSHKGVPEPGILSKPSQILDSGEEWEIRPLLWLQMEDSDLSESINFCQSPVPPPKISLAFGLGFKSLSHEVMITPAWFLKVTQDGFFASWLASLPRFLFSHFTPFFSLSVS